MKQKKAYSYIRFSTKAQIEGDSENRQLEATKKFCKENDLILDESTTLRDLGLSAYNGAHKTKGALKRFLQLVEKGNIEKGSVLIVESLDRLSREDVLTALGQFTDIIRAGIKLVTLYDNMTYDKESITKNWTQLIISITYMARANEESELKSVRVKAAKQKNRDLARTTKRAFSTSCPYWLKLNKKTGKYEPVKKVVDVVKRAFELKLQGLGSVIIARKLNEDPKLWKPPITKINKTGGWHYGYIGKMLRNRAVLGEYQPHTTNEQKQYFKEGEPIKDYYPKIIDEKTFNAVQQKLEAARKRPGKSGGRIGHAYNILSGFAFCGNCGGALHYIPCKNGKYNYSPLLVCTIQRRGKVDKKGNKICTVKPFKYDEVVEILLKNLEELDIKSIISNKSEKDKIQNLKKEIDSLMFEQKECERKQHNITEHLINEDNKTLRNNLSIKFDELQQQKEKINTDLYNKEEQLNHLQTDKNKFEKGLENIKHLHQLLDKINEKDNEKAKSIRLQLKAKLKELCEKIIIYSLNDEYKQIEHVEHDIYRIMKSKTIDRIKIIFNNKNFRVIYLDNFVKKID